MKINSKIANLAPNKYTTKEIVNLTGLSTATIYYCFKKLGVTYTGRDKTGMEAVWDYFGYDFYKQLFDNEFSIKKGKAYYE